MPSSTAVAATLPLGGAHHASTSEHPHGSLNHRHQSSSTSILPPCTRSSPVGCAHFLNNNLVDDVAGPDHEIELSSACIAVQQHPRSKSVNVKFECEMCATEFDTDATLQTHFTSARHLVVVNAYERGVAYGIETVNHIVDTVALPNVPRALRLLTHRQMVTHSMDPFDAIARRTQLTNTRDSMYAAKIGNEWRYFMHSIQTGAHELLRRERLESYADECSAAGIALPSYMRVEADTHAHAYDDASDDDTYDDDELDADDDDSYE